MIKVQEYGLGAVLFASDKMSPVLKKAGKNIDMTERRATGMANTVNRSFGSLKSSFSGFQSTMMRSGQMVAGAAAIAAPLILAGKQAANFEDALGDIKSLLVTKLPIEDVPAELRAVQDELLATGRNSRIALMDLATSFYPLESSLENVVEARQAIKPTADLAVAGLGTMQDAVGTMTLFLNTYGKAWGNVYTAQEKALKIANTVAGSIAAFNTTLPEQAQALQYVGGAAKVAGMSLSDLVTVVGAAQTAGLKGTLAGTALNAFIRQANKLVSSTGEEIDAPTMRELLDAAEEGAKFVPKASLKDLGVVDDQGKLLSFIDILKEIETRFGITAEEAQEVADRGFEGAEAFKQMGIDAKYSKALLDSFGEEGSRIILALLGQADALKKTSDEIERTNNLEKMLQARQETLIARLQMAKNRFAELAITIGEQFLPARSAAGETDWLDQLQSKISGLSEWAKDHPVAVQIGGGIGAGLAGLLAAGATINLGLWSLSPFVKIAKAVGPLTPAIRILSARVLAVATLLQAWYALYEDMRDYGISPMDPRRIAAANAEVAKRVGPLQVPNIGEVTREWHLGLASPGGMQSATSVRIDNIDDASIVYPALSDSNLFDRSIELGRLNTRLWDPDHVTSVARRESDRERAINESDVVANIAKELAGSLGPSKYEINIYGQPGQSPEDTA